MKNTKVIRHGDVVLYAVPKNKAEGKIVNQNGSYVLSEGTTTGHKHLLTAKMEVRQGKKGIYLSLKEDGKLTHEEHDELTLPKGTWFVGKEMEVDHFSKTTRQVID